MARQLRRHAPAGMLTPAARNSTARPAMRAALRPEIGQRGRGIRQFIGEVRAELRKVVWPTRQEAAKLTALVVSISVAVGIVLGGIDYAFSELFRLIVVR
jgi:preprotein translocase subunit SecE